LLAPLLLSPPFCASAPPPACTVQPGTTRAGKVSRTICLALTALMRLDHTHATFH
jgi:hypothetical protein